MRMLVADLSGICHEGRKSGALQAAEKPLNAVILSGAKNLGSCIFNELGRSFVACGSSG
jgi:hypothetical protein